MAKELKDVTKAEDNYSQWYNDLVVKAGLAENSAVRGCMVIKPYGYAIWEKMQAALMDEIQQNIFRKALDYRNSMITKVDTWDEFVDVLENKGGFISAHWDGTVETEVAIKDATKATIRCIPMDAVEEEGKCVFSGKPSHRRVLFARSY